jgi:hypothetical protein
MSVMSKPKNFYLLSLMLTLGLLLTLTLGGCAKDGDGLSLQDEDTPNEAESSLELAVASEFAPYRLEPVGIVPSLEPQPIAPDLSNVYVPMTLSAAQRERLAADGFVVSPGLHELIVLESADMQAGPGATLRTLSVWDWHGWGFNLRWRSEAGQYSNLTLVTAEDGDRPQLFVRQCN